MNNQEKETLLLALCGVFAWVASADSKADVDEFHKFTHVMLESPFATHYTEVDIRHTYKDMVELFLHDFDDAMDLTLERMKKFKDNPMIKEEFLRLARAAVVADAKIHPHEENALKVIKKELEIDEDV